MSIYYEFIERVSNGECFCIDFENRNMKVGKDFLIKEGMYDSSKELFDDMWKMYDVNVVIWFIKELYAQYKYSLPSERSDNKRKKYFKALPMEEITDEQLMAAERREVAQAALEGYVLCMIVSGKLIWDEHVMQGKWFWQSKDDPDLVLLRSWVEGK
jgi:hypothetical protein